MDFVRPLSPEDLMVQSCAEASPAKWHLAHSSWFFETFVLRDFLKGYKDFHPDFSWLFNSYYNALGEMPEKKLRASFSRPPLDAILAYRVYVEAALERLLEGDLEPDIEEEVARRVRLGLEHEQQHLELLATDIKHALYTNPLHPAYREGCVHARQSTDTEPLAFTDFAGGVVRMGTRIDFAADEFAFDNETPEHQVYLQPYALANRLSTCAEYLEFIEDRAYERPELWLSEGWTALRAEGWHAPLYWVYARVQSGEATTGWKVYTLDGFRPLDDLLDTPVCHLSLFEADAFARWSALKYPGARLPTEAEWEHAARSISTRAEKDASGVERLTVSPASVANTLETGALAPLPAPRLPGLQQMFGDVWEWTSSGYTGYPGYRALPGALGEYNGKFMSSQVILRGGSCVTPATHIRPTYRNFFTPGTRWQFSGVRLAVDTKGRR